MIDRCPRCNYSLWGLPDEHVCPECGLWCERDCEIVQRPRLQWILLAIANGVIFSIGLVLWTAYGIFSFFLITLIGVVSSVWRLRGPRRMILISREAVRVFGRSSTEETYPMASILRTEWDGIMGDIFFFGHNGELLTRLSYRFFWSRRASRRVVLLVDQYRTVNTGSQERRGTCMHRAP